MAASVLEQGDIRLTFYPDEVTLHLQIGTLKMRGICAVEVLTAASRRPLRVAAQRVLDVYQEPAHDAHGAGQRLTVRLAGEVPDLTLTLEIALYEGHPFAALRVGLTNHDHPTLRAHALIPFATTALEMGNGPLDSWVNGYHSWSFSGFVPHTRRQPRMVVNFLTYPQAENPTTRYASIAGCTVGEWVGALIDGHRQALIAGFMGLERQFGQVYMDGRPAHKALQLENTADSVPLPIGETLWSEWAILYAVDLPHGDPLGAYAKAVTRLTPGRWPHPHPAPGWSSWYQFFDAVTAEDMERNQVALKTLADRLPLHLIQLDDGYQPIWGDWLEHNEKFPQGVKGWAESVRSDGFAPGLWLSPFTVEMDAPIACQHPDTILRDARGHPIHGGFLLKRWIKGLDPTHPATQDFVREVIDTVVHRWGIRYLKLDFLYCGALPGLRHDPTRTRAQALRDGLRLIREVAGEDVTILGCGCPFGPAVGLVDIMRVGPDVAPEWYPAVLGLRRPFRRDFSLPAARNSISTSLQRAWTHRRWWWLDADNLLVRPQQRLSADEVQTLITVAALTGSHVILSDDLPQLPNDRLHWAASLLPLSLTERLFLPTAFAQTTPEVLIAPVKGVAGQHTLIGLINWADIPRTLSVEVATADLPGDQPLLVCDFWQRAVYVHQGETLSTKPLPPHGVALLALRPLTPGPQIVGSDLHISMGGEVAAWQVGEREVAFVLRLGRQTEGTIWLKLPAPPSEATCDGQPIHALPCDTSGLYALPVSVQGEAEVFVRF